jgi:hypothetical protein
MTFTFKKATPQDDRIMLALVGANNSGKTASALMLATGIVMEEKGSIDDGDIIVIDTENRRSEKYSGQFNFTICDFQPPFSPERYLESYQAALAQKPKVIIIDSMSHEHEGVGGVLEIHEQFLNDKCGNDWSKRDKMNMVAWGRAKKGRKALIMHGFQRSDVHTILCFRAKEKVAMVKDSKGKTQIVNDGWAAIGGDEYGYEVDVVFTLPPASEGRPDWSEKASRINDLKGDLKNLLHSAKQISVETGKGIKRLSKVSEIKPEPEDLELIDNADADEIRQWLDKLGMTNESLCDVMKVQTIFDIPKSKLDSVYKRFKDKESKMEAA